MNIDITFDNNWKKIAVSLSGGADSALLTYLLCKKITNNKSPIEVHVISHIRGWKTKPWQEHDGIRIYNWMVNQFPNIKFIRHANFIPPEFEHGYKNSVLLTDEYNKSVSGDTIEIRAFAEYVCFHNNIDAYFNGVTRNPIGVTVAGALPARNIEPTDDNQYLVKTMHMGKLACHPFRFVDKSWIVLQYKLLEIEELFKLTRSCEGEFRGLDYNNYVPNQNVPLCGECFWCKERAWAIEQSK